VFGVARVSVIIPAYNPGAFLGEALESVHTQTFTDWDAVVVEDGGEQDVSAIVEQFPRVRLIRQSNFGASVARNRGLFATDGPLVSFMDQDDIWAPDKLAHQIDAMNAFPDAGACFCDLQVFRGPIGELELSDRPDQPLLDAVLDPDPDEAESARFLRSVRYFNSGFIVPSTTMLRRECLAWSGLLDPWTPFAGDMDLLIKMGTLFTIIRIDSVDVLYRKHSGNWSDDYDEGRRELRVIREKYRYRAGELGDREFVGEVDEQFVRSRRLYAAQAFDAARYSWGKKDIRMTAHHLMRSVMFNPLVACSAVRHRFRR
jgi:glycosyltransferase involved in cell wall biosynthesis